MIGLDVIKFAVARNIFSRHTCIFISKKCKFGTSASVEARNKVPNVKSFYDRYIFPQPPDNISEDEHDITLNRVNQAIVESNHERLFAVVLINGKQYKITDHDLIQTTGCINAAVGSKICLEKVLLVGGSDFTLVGKPLVQRSLVNIEATLIENTPGFVKAIKRFRGRKQFQKTYEFTPLHSVIRINSIVVNPHLDQDKENEYA